MQPKKLEHYKYFQPIAWGVCILFASYVMVLALNVDTELERLNESTLSFETRLQNLEKAVGTEPVNPTSN